MEGLNSIGSAERAYHSKLKGCSPSAAFSIQGLGLRAEMSRLLLWCSSFLDLRLGIGLRALAVRVHVSIDIHTYIHTYIPTYVRMYVYIYIHTYIYRER